MLSARGVTGPEFVRMVKDQYDQLHADAAQGGRVLALALHPFVTGQAFRAKYFDQALEFLSAQPGVWLTTSDEIAEHYRRTAGSARAGAGPAAPRPTGG
jgi:allantoinase